MNKYTTKQMMDKNIFFKEIGKSLFNGRLTSGQREGMEAKLDAFIARGIADDRWRAYMLATSYHETGRAMQPVEETGRGKGKPYGAKRKHDGTAYTWPDRLYYGRGDVQLTWYENYEKMGKLLGIPLLENPELALDPDISAAIMIEGMTWGGSGRGDFTGVSLEDYFNDRVDDPVNARRVVNGLDRAHWIAGYHTKFLAALRLAMVVTLLLLMGAGCRPSRVVTERVVAGVDSTAVQALTDSLYRKEKQIAFLQTRLTRAREENTRFEGETRARETHYDTAAPVDSVTGKPPVLKEIITRTSGRYEKVVEDDEARQAEWTGAQERLVREHATQTLTVDKQTRADMALQEKSSSSRFNYKLFLAGVATGLVIALLLRRVL